MKNIVEIAKTILPQNAKKVVFFCEIEENANECSYYFFDGQGNIKQCYELAEEGMIDSVLLDNTFEKIVEYLKNIDSFDFEKRNVVTIIIEENTEKIKIEKFDKSVGLYKLKKEWKLKYLV